jgi:hypothetical protein
MPLSDKERESIAYDINAFVETLGLPVSVAITEKNVSESATNAGRIRVQVTFPPNIDVSVEMDKSMLMHLAMIRGFIGGRGE